MIRWCIAAGADLLLIETMSTAREAVAALRAAGSITDIPIYVSLVPQDGTVLIDGTAINAMPKMLRDCGADLVALNCAPVSVMRAAMVGFASSCNRAGVSFGCYPNASERTAEGSWDLQASTDEEIASLLAEWRKAGAALLGTCCGTTPVTTSLLATRLTD